MKTSTIVIILVIVAVIGGGAYLFSQQKPSTKSDQDLVIQKTEMMDDKAAEGSRYVVYTPSILEQTADKKRVLFFYANWCPTCRPADANFTANVNDIPSDVVLIRVNYNDSDTDEQEKALAQKYGITYQHTFVQIDAQGNEVAKWNGGQIEELLQNVQ